MVLNHHLIMQTLQHSVALLISFIEIIIEICARGSARSLSIFVVESSLIFGAIRDLQTNTRDIGQKLDDILNPL